ncbi:MAG: alpha-1,2-fucosyltransferase [Methanoregula sp.]|nr:alpha-1,2-fucosyltransferase [Methanoregula sp.]
MFQYAIGRKLSCMHKVPLKLDVSGFKEYTLRTYRLSHFPIPADFASDFDIENIKFHNRSGILRSLDSLTSRFQPYYQRNVFKEPHFPYDPNILKCNNHVYLEGYWQTEKYFKDIKEIILRDFTIVEEPDPRNKTMADQIRGSESVSIHVRRGDYVTNPTTNAYHGTCSEDYYKKAIQIIKNRVHKPQFFIFSDDLTWVREHLDIGYPTVFVDFNGPDKDYEDLRLMSLCQNHIIANSSFSWWGAYLGSDPGKIVIAPKRWFKKTDIITSDLLPESWIQL